LFETFLTPKYFRTYARDRAYTHLVGFHINCPIFTKTAICYKNFSKPLKIICSRVIELFNAYRRTDI
jgi:hypothetical protein